jgi:copper chaperone CopZ
MDCAVCTKVLAKRLSRVPGVAIVDVDYDHAIAVVTHDGKRDLTKELLDAVEDVGTRRRSRSSLKRADVMSYDAGTIRGPMHDLV